MRILSNQWCSRVTINCHKKTRESRLRQIERRKTIFYIEYQVCAVFAHLCWIYRWNSMLWRNVRQLHLMSRRRSEWQWRRWLISTELDLPGSLPRSVDSADSHDDAVTPVQTSMNSRCAFPAMQKLLRWNRQQWKVRIHKLFYDTMCNNKFMQRACEDVHVKVDTHKLEIIKNISTILTYLLQMNCELG